jgi:hypothetical protein
VPSVDLPERIGWAESRGAERPGGAGDQTAEHCEAEAEKNDRDVDRRV